MVLNYNTNTFADIVDDLSSQYNSGNLTPETAAPYLLEKYNVTKDEFNEAAAEARKAEDEYYKAKEEEDDSLFFNLSYPIPAHLREKEESLGRSILKFPGRAVTSGVRTTAEGVGQLFEMVFPKTAEEIGEVTEKVDKTLSENKITKPLVDTLKQTFDPKTTTAEDIVGEVGALATGTGVITKGIKYAAPAIKGIAARVPAFVAADLLITDKDESLTTFLVNQFPETLSAFEALAIDPNDDAATKILKKSIDALGIGLAGEALASTIGAGIRGYRKIKSKDKAIKDDVVEPIEDTQGRVSEVNIVRDKDGDFNQTLKITEPIKLVTPRSALTGAEKTGKEGNFLQRWFTSRQGLDELSFQALENKDNTLRGISKFLGKQEKKFMKDIEKSYGKKYKNLNDDEISTLNKALGDTGRITDASDPQALKILRKDEKKRTAADQEYLDQYQIFLNNKASKEQREAFDLLPDDIKPAVKDMRVLVDDYSRRLSDAGFTKSISTKIDNNLGLYLTDDYQLFTSPVYRKRVKQQLKGKLDDVQIEQALGEARKFFAKELGKDATDDEITGAITSYVNKIDSKDIDLVSFFNMGKTPAKEGPYDIFKRKKVLSEKMIPLLNPVDDPLLRYQSTINKQAKILAEYDFLKDIRNIAESEYGKKLFTVGKAKGTDLVENLNDIASRYIQTTGRKANPVAGIFTSKTFKDKLAKGLDFNASSNPWLSGVRLLNGYISAAKTIGSEATHLVNIQGNGIMTIANGNLVGPALKSVLPTFKGALKSYDEIIKDPKQLKQILNNPAQTSKKVLEKSQLVKSFTDPEEYSELVRRGLIDQGVTQEYALRSIQEGVEGLGARHTLKHFNTDGSIRKGVKTIGQITKKGVNQLAELYKFEDSIFKVKNYYLELDKYKKAFDEETAKQIAAENVKSFMPIYSRTPRILKGVRANVPILGAFPSFTAEIFRNIKNTYKIAGRDIIQGLREGNRNLIFIGAERLASVLAATVGFYAYQRKSEIENNITNNDSKFIDESYGSFGRGDDRIFLEPLAINPKTGDYETKFLNASRTNPYDAPFKAYGSLGPKIVEALITGKITNTDDLDRILQEAQKIADPFITESLVLQAAMDLLNYGKDAPAEATFGERISIALQKGFKQLSPTTLIDIKDYSDRVDQEKLLGKPGIKYGFPRTSEDKLKRFFGITQETFSLNRSIQYNTVQKNKDIRDVANQFKRTLSELSEARVDFKSPESRKEFMDKIINLDGKYFDAQVKLAEYLYKAKNLNVTDKDGDVVKLGNKNLNEILSYKGIQKIDPNYDYSRIKNVTKNGVGVYRPLRISQNFYNKLIKDKPQEIRTLIDSALSRLISDGRSAPPLLREE